MRADGGVVGSTSSGSRLQESRASSISPSSKQVRRRDRVRKRRSSGEGMNKHLGKQWRKRDDTRVRMRNKHKPQAEPAGGELF